jgi:hypothetical protein
MGCKPLQYALEKHEYKIMVNAHEAVRTGISERIPT